MKVLLVSDCHSSQICGVTRKQQELVKQLRLKNHIPKLLSSDSFVTVPLPHFQQVRLAIPSPFSYYKVVKVFRKFKPDIICILTEGPLGLMAALHCNLHRLPYTTMRCTQYENYVQGIHTIISTYLDWFHSCSRVCITPSPTLAGQYKHPKALGILNGCNTTEFTPEGNLHKDIINLPSPRWLYVGRISKEKNVDVLVPLAEKLPGSMILVGSGPHIANMKQRTNIYYLGWKRGEELSEIYRSCDVFVFPSKTDTFGQVMVEAMASGLPVAAYPVVGPIDVVNHGVTGYLDEDLQTACEKAYETKDSQKCIDYAKTFRWSDMCDSFMECQVICENPPRDRVYLYLGLAVFVLSLSFLL